MTVAPFTIWLRGQFDKTPTIRATQVASEAGINEGYLSALRSGRNARPSSVKVEALARAFAHFRGLSPAEVQELIDDALEAAARPPARRRDPLSEGAAPPGSAEEPSWNALGLAFAAASGSR